MNEKNKQLLKKIRWELIAVILLIVMLVGTFFKEAFAANEKGYNTSGYCYLNVGTNTARVNVSYAGTKNTDADYNELSSNGSHRPTFLGSSHKINIALQDTTGSISLTDSSANTVKDSEGVYSTIFFRVKFKVPAHYYFSGTSKVSAATGALSFVEDNVVSSKNRYDFPGDCKHGTEDHYETVWVRLNLANTHMIVDGDAEWHHAKLVVNSHRDSYTVLYKANGGTLTNSNTKDDDRAKVDGNDVSYTRLCGEGLGREPTVVRSGYKFAGWYDSSNNKRPSLPITVCGSSKVYYAHWTPYYKLSYNAGGVVNNPATATILSGEKYGNLPSLSQTGYKFDGWYDSATGGTKVTSNNTISGDTTIYAHWTAYKHKITYDLQGGSYPSSLKNQSNVNGYKIIPNGVYSLKSSCGSNMYMHVYNASYESGQKPGAVIWSGKGDTQTQWIFERYKDTQYYFIISVHNGLALSLDGAAGSNTVNNGIYLEKQYIDDDKLWYISDEGNGKVSLYNKDTNKCLDVYGGGTTDGTKIWQYEPNHSTAQQWTMEATSQNDYPSRMHYGNHYFNINFTEPERENYDFYGWCTKADGTGDYYNAGDQYNKVKTTDENVTLYAIWNVHDFTISFDANGGTGTMSTLTKKGYESFTLPANTFTRKGYTFVGWSTERYSDKVIYKDKGTYENSLAKVTLYAQWRRNTAGFIQRPFQDAEMFRKNTELTGGNGTPYDKDKIDSRMAHIDEDDSPGYFSNGTTK